MMLDLEMIQKSFSLLSGEDPAAETERAELCRDLCAQCAAWIEARIQGREEQATDYQTALEAWAAAEAWVQLTLIDEAAGPESISADGVTLKEGERSAKAKALASEKQKAVSPVLGEEGFYFGQV